jgi:hypothetical protein
MDRKSIIVLVISFVILMAWYPLMNRLYPPKPQDSNLVTAPTNRLAEDNSLSPPTGPATPARQQEISSGASGASHPFRDCRFS